MSTDSGPADPHARQRATARVLRLSMGVTVAMLVAFVFAWPLYFLTPVLAATLLATPAPAPTLPQAAGMLGYVVVAFAVGLAFTLLLLPFPLLHVLALGLTLFRLYYLANRGGPGFLVLMTLLAVLILPMLAMAHDTLAVGFAVYFGASAALSVLIWVVSHGLVADPPAPPRPAAPRAPRVGYSRTAALAAARSTLVIWPLAIAFIAAGWTSELLVLVFAAIFSLSPDIATSRSAGVASLVATAIGGAAALVLYFALVAVPQLLFFAVAVLLATLVMARAIFSGHRLSPYLSSALTVLIVLTGSAMDPEVAITEKLLVRMVLVGAATLYVVGALYALERFTRRWSGGSLAQPAAA